MRFSSEDVAVAPPCRMRPFKIGKTWCLPAASDVALGLLALLAWGPASTGFDPGHECLNRQGRNCHLVDETMAVHTEGHCERL
jgi:hypothetical protein